MKATLRAACGTHPGQLREINQDSALSLIRSERLGQALGLFIVADGMGGHKAGDIASKLAVETIKDNLAWMLEQDDAQATVLATAPVGNPGHADKMLERRLRRAVEEANQTIHNYSIANEEEAGNLGCTVTCVLVAGSKAVIGNVGDSRTYLYRVDELRQITDDHSYVWQLVREGFLQVEDIYDHPQRNVITRALGNQDTVDVDTCTYSLEDGDRLLLCSDGVWEMIRDPAEIAAALDNEELEAAVDQLILAANYYGGLDNIGVVVAEFQSTEVEAD
ncbi:MAG: Stp1/IreP family PP2C-type Ser/Thr phosphatase [Chloroflexota bacterium]|nr:MAG: Stp1/IreP family PP2C-type Ser/Thr phosphatase [Chloroflexota bacterium]